VQRLAQFAMLSMAALIPVASALAEQQPRPVDPNQASIVRRPSHRHLRGTTDFERASPVHPMILQRPFDLANLEPGAFGDWDGDQPKRNDASR
jgi:hypothetical protein